MPQQGRDEGLARFEYVFDISMQAPKDGELFQQYEWEWHMEHVDVSWLKTCQTKIAVDRMCHFRRFLHRTPGCPGHNSSLSNRSVRFARNKKRRSWLMGPKPETLLFPSFCSRTPVRLAPAAATQRPPRRNKFRSFDTYKSCQVGSTLTEPCEDAFIPSSQAPFS